MKLSEFLQTISSETATSDILSLHDLCPINRAVNPKVFKYWELIGIMIDEVRTLGTSFLVTSYYVFYSKKILVDYVRHMIFKSGIFTIFSATFVFTSWKSKLQSPYNSLWSEVKTIDIFNLRDLTQLDTRPHATRATKSNNARKRCHWHCNISDQSHYCLNYGMAISVCNLQYGSGTRLERDMCVLQFKFNDFNLGHN